VLIVNEQIQIPLEEFRWEYARSGGPGGQNVNKVASKATLRWPLTTSPSLPEHVKERLLAREKKRITTEGELLITSQRTRDQDKNRADCLEKLTGLIASAAIVPAVRKATRPTKSSNRRRLADKKARGAVKEARRPPSAE
jgi:ribosome-associated protein